MRKSVGATIITTNSIGSEGDSMATGTFEQQFNSAMYQLYETIVHECVGRYHPTAFFGMLERYGGLTTAHRLLQPGADFFSYGFERLTQLRRVDLTMEHMILSLPYRAELFSLQELQIAQERLTAAEALLGQPLA
jgi:hypothetical protein